MQSPPMETELGRTRAGLAQCCGWSIFEQKGWQETSKDPFHLEFYHRSVLHGGVVNESCCLHGQ